MGVTPARPTAQPAVRVAGGAARAPRAPWGWLLAALGALTSAALIGWLAYALAAARLPEHRAALERLVREQTRLDVRFAGLGLRWGWYGPEAVFRDVELGEPRDGALLVRAPQLVVGLDLWRMLRSGQPEADRITLVTPDIIVQPSAARAGSLPGAGPAQSAGPPWEVAARVLSRWRGGRIDIEGGTVSWREAGEALPATITVRHASVRRLAAQWSADAQVLLPETLGARAHVSVQLTGDPAHLADTAVTVRLEGERLEAAGWRKALAAPALSALLPQAGVADLELRLQFGAGQLRAGSGTVHAQALEWAARAGGAAPLAVPHLQGSWQLAQREDSWHLSVRDLKLAEASVPAALAVDAGPGLLSVTGALRQAPLATLADVARWIAPQTPLGELALHGEARTVSFDYDARRAPGERLRATARLADIALASADGAARLAGLSARLEGTDGQLRIELGARAAQLTLARAAQPVTLAELGIAGHLLLTTQPGGWQLSSGDLRIQHAEASCTAAATLDQRSGDAHPQLTVHATLSDASVGLLTELLGAAGANAFGGGLQLTAGRVTDAQLTVHTLLDGSPPWQHADALRGTLELRDASLAATEHWPQLQGLDAHLEWRGARWHAAVAAASAGTWQLTGATLDWDAGGRGGTHLSAAAHGDAQQALAWLRAQPQLAAAVPGAGSMDLRGHALLDVDLVLPPAAATSAPHSRITALLDGVQLQPLTGLPPLEGLRGTLTFSGGQLRRSLLAGRWLGGPVALTVAPNRERAATRLAISGRGVLDARAALQAAGGRVDAGLLQGSAEWTASLVVPASAATHGAPWRVRAESNLVGVVSRLPEPFAKGAGSALALRVDAQGDAGAGQLRVSLGERLRALLAVTPQGDSWRIERGAVQLAASLPALPARPLLSIGGTVGSLDLPAYVALWREAAADRALPPLQAQLAADELRLGAARYRAATVTAESAGGAGQVQAHAADLAAVARWTAPAAVGSVHFDALDAGQLAELALGSGLFTAVGSDVAVSADELRWQGRALGRFAARLTSRGEELAAQELQLTGGTARALGSAQCGPAGCALQFTLDSTDAAGTLVSFGLRPDLAAQRARLSAELHWPREGAALALLEGRLHMQLEDGVTRVQSVSAQAAPFALLVAPAVVRGLAAPATPGAVTPELRFASLSADYALHDGQAQTTDLHFDGDAEILVHGRVGLRARDYDAQVWVLRGEERLPAALLRGLGAAPKMAALWLSLRGLFSPGSAEHGGPAALRLQGSWDEPLVMPAE